MTRHWTRDETRLAPLNGVVVADEATIARYEQTLAMNILLADTPKIRALVKDRLATKAALHE